MPIPPWRMDQRQLREVSSAGHAESDSEGAHGSEKSASGSGGRVRRRPTDEESLDPDGGDCNDEQGEEPTPQGPMRIRKHHRE